MSKHVGIVKIGSLEIAVQTNVSNGEYRARASRGSRSHEYQGPTDGAGVREIALTVAKNFATRLRAKPNGLTAVKARQILHDKQVRGVPLTDAQRRFFGAMSKKNFPSGRRVSAVKRAAKKPASSTRSPRRGNHWLLPLAVGLPAGAVAGYAAHDRIKAKLARSPRQANPTKKDYELVARLLREQAKSQGAEVVRPIERAFEREFAAAGGRFDAARFRSAVGVNPRKFTTPDGRGVGRDFYVTVIDGERTGWLLGPFKTHGEALARVDLGRRMAGSVNDRAVWYAYGTASVPHGTAVKTVFTPAEAGSYAKKHGLSRPASSGRGRNPLTVSASGYVYELKGRGHSWISSSDEHWEVVVADVTGQLIGKRSIDGSRVDVVKSGGRYYAALPHAWKMANPRGAYCMSCGARVTRRGQVHCRACQVKFRAGERSNPHRKHHKGPKPPQRGRGFDPRTVASEWVPGMMSPTYAFVSTGHVDQGGLLREIASARRSVARLPKKDRRMELRRLDMLEKHVVGQRDQGDFRTARQRANRPAAGAKRNPLDFHKPGCMCFHHKRERAKRGGR